MGIYLPNMEMPKSCWRCTLSQLYEKPREMLVCKITHDEVLRHKIDTNCPLVHVPPHGRLIDADALDTEILQAGFSYALTRRKLRYTPGDVRQKIANAPTIIPAEEGGT